MLIIKTFLAYLDLVMQIIFELSFMILVMVQFFLVFMEMALLNLVYQLQIQQKFHYFYGLK